MSFLPLISAVFPNPLTRQKHIFPEKDLFAVKITVRITAGKDFSTFLWVLRLSEENLSSGSTHRHTRLNPFTVKKMVKNFKKSRKIRDIGQFSQNEIFYETLSINRIRSEAILNTVFWIYRSFYKTISFIKLPLMGNICFFSPFWGCPFLLFYFRCRLFPYSFYGILPVKKAT